MSKAATERRHNPLEYDISTSGGRLRTTSITGKRKSRSDENAAGDGYVDKESTRKILALSQQLADEDDTERQHAVKAAAPNAAFGFDSRFADEEEKDADPEKYEDEEADWMPEEEVVQADDLDPEDMAVYSKFLPEGDEIAGLSIADLSTSGRERTDPRETESSLPAEQGQTRNLADIMLAKIEEFEARQRAQAEGKPMVMGGGAPEDAVEIPAKAVEAFEKVGQILSRYKSGPLPKLVKVLPTLPQWPELLEITQPSNWTPHAIEKATKIFRSPSVATARHFYETVLLDKVRDDIHETGKLNVHLFEALVAALYRPQAFFQGILFPLVESGCTLKEARIVSSVVAKIKIPRDHAAVAIAKLCEISAEQTSNINSEAAGSANLFIRVLLDKKYGLPYQTLDALVFHYLRFRGSKEAEALGAKEAKLPVIWHQGLLVFAQRYRNEITEDQREALLDLLLVRGHRDIGPEIRRELLAGRNRGQEPEKGANGDLEMKDDGDDTMAL